MTDSTTIEEALLRGREKAVALDRALRDAERRALEEELDRRRTRSGGHLYGTDQSLARLEREVALLREQRSAIEASRVWRAAQSLRRLLGRAW